MYDLAIIGGGPAGYSAAFEAIRRKLKVVLFENREVGGTCLNRGCVPTKFLSHISRQFTDMQDYSSYGVLTNCSSVNYASIHSRMEQIISLQRDMLNEELKEHIDFIAGEASVLDCRTLECEGRTYEANNILIATGSQPVPPLIHNAISSDELLKMESIPDELHILGGGTVAVEFANIFQALGSSVKIYIRGDRILRKWDKDIAVSITQSFKRKGITIKKNCDFSSLKFDTGTVLSVVGREPVLPNLCANIVELGKSGGIVADYWGRTKTSGIFAAGDVVEGSSQLAQAAMEQGRNVVVSIVNGSLPSETELVRCLYLDQECASVGVDEKEAIASGIDFIVGKTGMYSNARTMISTKERGFIKILAERNSGRIIGAQLFCERAGDIVAEIALAINERINYKQMLNSVRPHPSYCEAVTEALRSLEEKNEILLS